MPQDYETSIFMAGGITGCPDWQKEILQKIEGTPVVSNYVYYNPRRSSFDTSRKEDSQYQIEWEYKYLRNAAYTYFWFPKEGKCMITLLELGMALVSYRMIRVGCHPEYERAFDVYHQVRLARPDLTIHTSLEDLYLSPHDPTPEP
ncbi:MAG TPA: nucleoside 2-deoxyribosyltransferase domain-containing protein [Methanosarcina sp.]|nr:nucleoside 2-deoxyribosyltransferase domain-containing protein [Methanosarcina sp.]